MNTSYLSEYILIVNSLISWLNCFRDALIFYWIGYDLTRIYSLIALSLYYDIGFISKIAYYDALSCIRAFFRLWLVSCLPQLSFQQVIWVYQTDLVCGELIHLCAEDTYKFTSARPYSSLFLYWVSHCLN